MMLQVFLLLLLSFFTLYLAQLCHLYWTHHWFPHPKAVALHSAVHRLLKPRSPHDCPACRLSSTLPTGVEPAPPPVRPWREVKSRRGAPKRVNTDGFACPNHQCPYFGITDAHIHALVGDGKHGHAERIQTLRGPACRTTFTARRHTPLYRLKTPSQQVAVVLTALAEGLDPSAAERVFGYRQATITTWLSRAARARSDSAQALFLQPPIPSPAVGRTANQATQLHTGAVVVAGNRPPHEEYSCTPPGSTYAKHRAYGHPLPAADPGRLSASRSSRAMA